MLNDFAPDVVIGVGGYASGPAMLAAMVKDIPTLAFEPNVVPGFANRMVARWFQPRRCISRRPQVFSPRRSHRRAGAAGVFRDCRESAAGTPTLLVFGGSQGAHAINQAMIRCLPVLLRSHRAFTSSIRPASATIMTRRRLPARGRVGGESLRSSTTCRRLSRGRSGGLPLGREHGRGNRGGREAGDLRAFSAGRGRSSARECAGAGAARRGGGGGRIEAGRSLAGGNDRGACCRIRAAAADEPGGARVGASQRGADIAAMAARVAGIEER